MPEPSITCPFCRVESFNMNDIAQAYCGNCHAFHSDPCGRCGYPLSEHTPTCTYYRQGQGGLDPVAVCPGWERGLNSAAAPIPD